MVRDTDAHVGSMLESKQRFSPDTAGASALGAAETGPDRSLVRRGMGKGMAMTWAGQKLLNAHSPVGLTQPHATMDTAVTP